MKDIRPGGRIVARRVIEQFIVELGDNDLHKWTEQDITKAHDELVEACGAALYNLEHDGAINDTLGQQLKEALAKAEGGSA